MSEKRQVKVKLELDTGGTHECVVDLEPGMEVVEGETLLVSIEGDVVVLRRPSDDPFDDPGYRQFYEEAGRRCRCNSPQPCGGVLGGGMCDEIG